MSPISAILPSDSQSRSPGKPSPEWFGTAISPRLPPPSSATSRASSASASSPSTTPDGVLQPNANINVTVTTAQHMHVLSVPREALHFDGAQPYVFRIIQNKLVRTRVQLGIVNLTQAEITSGLSETDTVALNATTNRDLNDGLEITPVQ